MGGFLGRVLGARRDNQPSQSPQQGNNNNLSTCGPEGCGPASQLQSRVVGSVPPVDLRNSTSIAGSPTTATPNAIISSLTPANPGATTITTSPTQNTKGVVNLGDGIHAQIKDGKILATISLTNNQSAGKVEYAYQGNAASGSRRLKTDSDLSNFVKAEVGGLTVEKSRFSNGAPFVNVHAANDLDTVTLKFTDASGKIKEVTLSREAILKAEQDAAKKASESPKKQAEPKATPEASAPQATREPKKEAVSPAPAAEVPKALPQSEVKKTDVAPSATAETEKPSEPSTAAETLSAANGITYEQKLSVQAQQVENALQSKTGWYLSNYPALDTWQSNLGTALAQFPTVAERAALVEKVTPEKLGLLIHESTAFQAPGAAMDMILEPLSDKAYVLKSAVDTIHKEFAKVVSSYDQPAIKDALEKLDRIEKELPGASKLAAVYYSKIANDDRYTTPYTFDEAVKTLRDAVASKAE